LLAFAHQVRGVRAVGSAALALAWVAAGRLEAYTNFNLSAWDIAAGSLLIEEAGGRAATMAGEPLALVESTSCLGTNGLIHVALQELLQR
jgi:myo-inositol-1(or 4)-monophosphatase